MRNIKINDLKDGDYLDEADGEFVVKNFKDFYKTDMRDLEINKDKTHLQNEVSQDIKSEFRRDFFSNGNIAVIMLLVLYIALCLKTIFH